MTKKYTKFNSKNIMESDVNLFHVADVYDLAANICSEWKPLISMHGAKPYENLVTLIRDALAKLEENIVDKDSLENKLADLKMRIAQLETEKEERFEGQQRYQKELESMEEMWKLEMAKLTEELKLAREENKQLRRTAARAHSQPCEYCQTSAETAVLVQDMKSSMERLHHQLGQRDHELRHTSESLETTQVQLGQMNTLLRDQVKQLQRQVHSLVEEKSFLQVQLASSLALDRWLLASSSQEEGVNKEQAEMVPVGEMKKLMWERDDLLSQVQDLKEELSTWKSAPSDPNFSLSSLSSSLSTATTTSSSAADLPVEGPINREPFEKLYPGKKVSRVQKFFSLLLGKDPYLPTSEPV